MNALEGYASATSVFPGETLSFHVSTAFEDYYFRIDIYRKGKENSLVHTGWGAVSTYLTPSNAYEVGCDWPAAYKLTIPDTWSSGVYEAHLTSVVKAIGPTTDILFVVKAAAPGRSSTILLQLTVNTYQAYNSWGGASLYSHPNPNRVSFDRPTPGEGTASFYAYEYDFVKWLENNGFAAEYCTSIDLHADAGFLNSYQLLISVGHDEYWSKEMRDNVETFIANGGNVAFFSGNVCWWQVRFEDNNRTMVCYKDLTDPPVVPTDPIVDPSRRTTIWRRPPVARPENLMTGVSYAHGGVWYRPVDGARPPIGYRVRFSQHWVFEGTGLSDGDDFGQEDLIIGYETDAALFLENNGVPEVTGVDGTPLNFIVLATADLPGWPREEDWSTEAPVGRATMGIYRNGGTVFTAATTDWSHGLRGSRNAISQITQNVLRRLSCSCQPAPRIANSGFEEWTAEWKPDSWDLEGAGSALQEEVAPMSRKLSLVVDATPGQTWLSQGPFQCEGRNHYRAGCWAKADRPGATIRLQSMVTWQDFAVAEHSGSGHWEYLYAVGNVDDEGPMFPARVKMQVADGVIAWFDNVAVEML